MCVILRGIICGALLFCTLAIVFFGVLPGYFFFSAPKEADIVWVARNKYVRFGQGGQSDVLIESDRDETVLKKSRSYDCEMMRKEAYQLIHSNLDYFVELQEILIGGKFMTQWSNWVGKRVVGNVVLAVERGKSYERVHPATCEELETLNLDVICGLENLHSMNVAHNDIKPANIMMIKNRCKILDLGSSLQFGLPIHDLITPGFSSSGGKYRQRFELSGVNQDIYNLAMTNAHFIFREKFIQKQPQSLELWGNFFLKKPNATDIPSNLVTCSYSPRLIATILRVINPSVAMPSLEEFKSVFTDGYCCLENSSPLLRKFLLLANLSQVYCSTPDILEEVKQLMEKVDTTVNVTALDQLTRFQYYLAKAKVTTNKKFSELAYSTATNERQKCAAIDTMRSSIPDAISLKDRLCAEEVSLDILNGLELIPELHSVFEWMRGMPFFGEVSDLSWSVLKVVLDIAVSDCN